MMKWLTSIRVVETSVQHCQNSSYQVAQHFSEWISNGSDENTSKLEAAIQVGDVSLVNNLLRDEDVLSVHTHKWILKRSIESLSNMNIGRHAWQAIFKMLILSGADNSSSKFDSNELISQVCRYGNIENLEYIISIGISLDMECTDIKKHPLYKALNNPDVSIILYILMKMKLDINTKDSEGRTIFHAAARELWIEQLELLLKLGADPNILCQDKPAIICALTRRSEPEGELFTFLVGCSCLPNIVSALKYAKSWFLTEHVIYILKYLMVRYSFEKSNLCIEQLFLHQVGPYTVLYNKYYQQQVSELQLEIARLDSSKVTSTLSIGDILRNLLMKKFHLLRNKEIIQYLERKNLYSVSKKYYLCIWQHYKRGSRWLTCCDKAWRNLSYLIELDPNAGNVILTTIMSFLTELEISVLAQTYDD